MEFKNVKKKKWKNGRMDGQIKIKGNQMSLNEL